MEVEIIPCTFRRARTIHPIDELYWVRIYLLIDENFKVHSFLHRSDLIDNCQLAVEAGVKVTTHEIEVLCSSSLNPKLFSEIQAYVSKSRSC